MLSHLTNEPDSTAQQNPLLPEWASPRWTHFEDRIIACSIYPRSLQRRFAESSDITWTQRYVSHGTNRWAVHLPHTADLIDTIHADIHETEISMRRQQRVTAFRLEAEQRIFHKYDYPPQDLSSARTSCSGAEPVTEFMQFIRDDLDRKLTDHRDRALFDLHSFNDSKTSLTSDFAKDLLVGCHPKKSKRDWCAALYGDSHVTARRPHRLLDQDSVETASGTLVRSHHPKSCPASTTSSSFKRHRETSSTSLRSDHSSPMNPTPSDTALERKIADLKERTRKAETILKNRLQLRDKRELTKQRKLETCRKILIGKAVLVDIEHDPQLKDWFY